MSKDNLTLFVVGHSDNFEAVPKRSWIKTVDLSVLPLGNKQINELAESRLFVSDLVAEISTDFVGCLSYRWHDKYREYLPLRYLNQLKYHRRYVWGPYLTPPDQWAKGSAINHPGMGALLDELSAFSGLPLVSGPTYWS